MKRTRTFGLVLWRGGLLLAFGYVAFRKLLQILTITDAQLEFAIAVLITGLMFVLLSVIGEQIADAREERSRNP